VQGIEKFNRRDALAMESEDKDYHLRDLYDSIATLYRA
jgi:catalase